MTPDAAVSLKAIVTGVIFAGLFLAERIWRAAPPVAGRARLYRNAALWLLLILISPVIVLPLTAAASAHPLWIRPSGWPGALVLAIDIVILDLWSYWLHRAYHEAPLLRRLHQVHHLDETLDTTSAVRFHPGEVALSAVLRMAPIALLAIPFLHVVIFEAVILSASLFHHSNVRLPSHVEALISRVVVTPSIHWVHHHAAASDLNSNYAAVFSLWDRLFRTRSRTTRTPAMEIGLPGVEDKSAIRLLLAPVSGIEMR